MPDAVVSVNSVGHGGHGVCRLDQQVCFVPYALPGDVVTLSEIRRNRGVLWGTIGQIVEPSLHRVSVACPVFGSCGGCSWLHFAYPAQAEWKQRIVQDCFERIGRINIEPAWADDPDLRLGYRTRASFHGDGGNWGFYAQNSHRIVPIEECPLCHPHLNEAFDLLRKSALQGTVELTVNPEGPECLVWCRKGWKQLKHVFAHAEGPGTGTRHRFLFDGIPIVNGTFSQSSLLINRVLRRVVHEAIGAPQRLLDLYCGNGNFSLAYADKAHVQGIDHNRTAVKAAAAMGKGDYGQGDETAFVEALRSEALDVALLDPPRQGTRAVIPALSTADVGAVVYVSCDPATLARDAAKMRQAGWHVSRVTVVDMFPHTPHIETVCRFTR